MSGPCSLDFVFENLLTFCIAADDGVVDGKDVVRVDGILDVLLPLDGHGRKSAFHEALSDFSHSVVVTNTAAVLHDLVTGRIFDSLVQMHGLLAA